MEKILYSQAQKDENLRQAYLDSFFSNRPCDDVNRLVYNKGMKPADDKIVELWMKGFIDDDCLEPARAGNREGKNLAMLVFTVDTFGAGEKHEIFVNPGMFELEEAVAEFSIADHEYFHAKDFRYGISFQGLGTLNNTNVMQIEAETINSILETRAFLNQFLKGEEKGMNSSLMKACARKFLGHHAALRSISPQSQFEEGVIKAQIGSYRPMLQKVFKTAGI